MNSVATTGASLSAFSRLESLPVELLEMVFDKLDDVEPPELIHPISRALRPYVQRNQYRFIKVDYSHFLLLCRTISDSPHLASLIKNFTLVAITSGSSRDFEIKHESLVFNFFKLVSLESFVSSKHHPRLQHRILSTKYAIHSNKSLKSLTLHFPGKHAEADTDSQSRFLSCFAELESLYVILGEGESSDFTGEEGDQFEEEDLEIARSGLNISINNTIRLLDIEAGDFFGDLGQFGARFHGLLSLNLTMSNGHSASCVLAAIDPVPLRRLFIVAPEPEDHAEVEIDKSDIAPFINLDTLMLPENVYDTDFVTSLSAFSKLSQIVSLSPGCPSAFDSRILLDPRTGPPALKELDFQPHIWLVSNEQPFSIYFYDPITQGHVLPQWEEGWTVDEAREILELAERRGIELPARESFEKAFTMTDDYWATREGESSGEESSDGDESRAESEDE